jgi:hypothetical protein
VAVRTQHLAKPGRRAIVVTDLANLRGPAQGTVGLPLRLSWSSADRRFETPPFRRLRCHILDAAHRNQAADLTACKAWVLSRCDDPADRLDDTGRPHRIQGLGDTKSFSQKAVGRPYRWVAHSDRSAMWRRSSP